MSDERPTGPMFGTMTEADFPNDTITLEMEPGYYTAKMRFAVVNADEFAEIVKQRAALLEALVRCERVLCRTTEEGAYSHALECARAAIALAQGGAE